MTQFSIRLDLIRCELTRHTRISASHFIRFRFNARKKYPVELNKVEKLLFEIKKNKKEEGEDHINSDDEKKEKERARGGDREKKCRLS